MKISGKVWIVTGGANGIGRELSLQLLKKGAKVAVIDLSATALEETQKLASAGANLSIHQIDISDKNAVENLPQQIIAHHGTVDGIINNAGIIQPFIPVNDLSYDRIQKIMGVNFYGTLYMIKSFLPILLNRPEAHIVNVSSMGGFIPFPKQTFYSASKAGVKTLTEGLYAELLNTSVKVTLILPGAINTNITQNSGVEMNISKAEQSKMKMLNADKAAEQIIKAVEKDKFSALVGSDAKFLDLIYRINPGWAVRFIAKKMSHL